VQNLVGIDLAVTKLRIREMSRLRADFLLTYLSLYPFLLQGYRLQFGAIITLDSSNDVFSQPLVPFEGLVDIAVH